MSEQRLVVQLSDLHIVPEGQELHGRVDTTQVVADIFESLERLDTHVDAVLLTGDLADTADPASYRRLRALVEPAAERLGTELVYLMGNHDARPAFRRELLGLPATEESVDRVVWANGLRIIALDSTVPGEHHGELDDAQLEWLAAELATPAPYGTIVAFHHPPVFSPLPLLRKLTLLEPERLTKVVDGTDALLVVAGHTHHVTTGLLGSVPVWVATATAYQSDITAPGRFFRGQVGNAFTRIDVVDGQAYPTLVPLAPGAAPLYEFDTDAIEAQIAAHQAEVAARSAADQQAV